MKRYLLLSVALAACTEYGPELTEQGRVDQTVYAPRSHSSGTSVGMDGKVGFVSVSTPEQYAVVFQCEHGKFVLEGTQNAERMWRSLSEGDSVTIVYREGFRGDGDERRLVDYDFIDARKVR